MATSTEEATTTEKKDDFIVTTSSDEPNVVTDYFESVVANKPKDGKKPKVVILGAGWGGYNFGKYINKDEFEVILVSPRNHFLFTPLLPSTTVGTLEYKCIQEPVRSIENLQYRQALAQEIDFENKKI